MLLGDGCGGGSFISFFVVCFNDMFLYLGSMIPATLASRQCLTLAALLTKTDPLYRARISTESKEAICKLHSNNVEQLAHASLEQRRRPQLIQTAALVVVATVKSIEAYFN